MARNQICLQSFLGRWTILREIQDELHHRKGRLEGRVTITPDDNDPTCLHYGERGLLQMEGAQALQAERRYIWRQGKSGNSVDVHFEDNSPFHSFDLDRTMPYDTHICSPDNYQVSYDFRSWPVWRSEWRVQGPKKNYRLWTRYRFMGGVTQRRTPCVDGVAGANVGQQTTDTKIGDEWLSIQPTES